METNSLEEIRESFMISKTEFARKSNISPFTLARIEQDKPCRMATKRKILLALGVKVMDTSLLRKIDLECGLEMEIYDVSRKLAGDRWYIGFIARVEIPINYLAGHTDSSAVDIEKMKDVLGGTIRFEQKRDRHYIDEKEKGTLLNGLIDDFLSSTLPYFSGKDFVKKYVLQAYKKKNEKASWYKT